MAPEESYYDVIRVLLQHRRLAGGMSDEGGMLTQYATIKTIFGQKMIPVRQFEVLKTDSGEIVREFIIKRGIFRDKRVLVREFNVKA